MKNWKEAVVNVDGTVRDVMRCIDKAALRTAFVCAEGQQLIGIVSDGDLRRGLLSSVEMHDNLSTVLNRSPIVVQAGAARSEIESIFNQGLIDILPVVDTQGRLVDVITPESLRLRPQRDNPIFIMAGGFGTRLRPLTENCPKPMLPIAQKPLLEHVIDRFKKQGFWNFYISTHFMPEVITRHFGDGKNFGISVTYVHEEVPLGTGGALGLLPKNIGNLPLIVINGDILTDLDFTELIDFHSRANVDATMCLREVETAVAYGVVSVDRSRVSGMVEKPVYRHLINTGIYVLSHECVNAVEQGVNIDLPTLLEKRMKKDYEVGAYKFFGKWIDIGKMEDYSRAQEEVLNNE